MLYSSGPRKEAGHYIPSAWLEKETVSEDRWKNWKINTSRSLGHTVPLLRVISQSHVTTAKQKEEDATMKSHLFTSENIIHLHWKHLVIVLLFDYFERERDLKPHTEHSGGLRVALGELGNPHLAWCNELSWCAPLPNLNIFPFLYMKEAGWGSKSKQGEAPQSPQQLPLQMVSPYVFQIWSKRYYHFNSAVLESQYICFHFRLPQPAELEEHIRKKKAWMGTTILIFFLTLKH